jgi:hypothetical protein
MSHILEPSFCKKLGPVLEFAHKELERNDCEIRIEYNRKPHDDTDFFLYHIENYFLVGAEVNRTKVRDPTKYSITLQEDFKITKPELNSKNEVEMIEDDIRCT